jgi:four helix bundle protein
VYRFIALAIARGALYELQTQLELAGGLGLLEQEKIASLMEQSEEVGRMINGLLATLRPPTR